MVKYPGSKTWFIPDGFWPKESKGNYPSHEAICVLNASPYDAQIEITLYFEDRQKMTGFKAHCPSDRTKHIRMDTLTDENGNKVPLGIPYAMMVKSNTEIIVQYSRMDTSQAEMALMTTIAYPVD